MKIFGRDIIREVAREYRLRPDDITGRSRSSIFVKARIEAIHRLKAAGFNRCQTARLLNRDHTTILHHLNEKRREKSLARARRHHERRKAARQGIAA